MPYYEIVGYGRDTNRKRKRRYFARNQESAIYKAGDDGTIVETVTQVPDPPPEPPTDPQIKYASDLGIQIPPDITKNELSDLIDKTVLEDDPPPEWLRRHAIGRGLTVSKYVGAQRLCKNIAHTLDTSELVRWFLYRVYRHLTGGRWEDPSESSLPHDELLDLARVLITDTKFMRSFDEGYLSLPVGLMVLRFGDVYLLKGSTRTIAYKTAAELLRQKFDIGMPQPQATATIARRKEKSGCLVFLVIGTVAAIAGCVSIAT